MDFVTAMANNGFDAHFESAEPTLAAEVVVDGCGHGGTWVLSAAEWEGDWRGW